MALVVVGVAEELVVEVEATVPEARSRRDDLREVFVYKLSSQ